VAISAPFFEETFFRGVFLNAMLLKVRPVWACLLTGIMFGGIHPVGISGVLALATLGTVFAWIAYLRKSLVPSMVAHCLQNSYVFFTLYLGFAAVFNR
jgi:membrane protease YdiL (CAAX protease family)